MQREARLGQGSGYITGWRSERLPVGERITVGAE
jgi:hypothetical protein